MPSGHPICWHLIVDGDLLPSAFLWCRSQHLLFHFFCLNLRPLFFGGNLAKGLPGLLNFSEKWLSCVDLSCFSGFCLFLTFVIFYPLLTLSLVLFSSSSS